MKTTLVRSLIAFLFLCSSGFIQAQDSLIYAKFTIPEVIALALKNSAQLKVISKSVEAARQQVEVEKLYQLPGISSGLDLGYISNADIWNSKFSDHQKGNIPHRYGQLSVQVGEVLYKGGAVRESIEKANFEAQIAVLTMGKNTEGIKFFIGGLYLDIFRSINLRKVYVDNEELASHRLTNVLFLRKEGMVTENDVLRTQLTVSDLQLTIRKIDNTIAILNEQLNMVAGLPTSNRLIPDSALLNYQCPPKTIDQFISQAYIENYETGIAGKEVNVSKTNLNLLQSERYPELSAFAGSTLQRPFLNTIPAVDIYYNIWQAGLSLRYNISSLYQSPRKIKAGKILLDQSLENEVLQKQTMEVDVRSHYTKYIEATDELATYKEEVKSAQENYRLVEKRYFAQSSLLVDLIDATNTKIDAETKVTNAGIDTIYAYFMLLRSVGNFKL